MLKPKEGGLLLPALIILASVWILCTISLLILDSAGSARANPHAIMQKQSVYLAVAAAALLAAYFANLHKLRRFAIPLAVATIALLLLVLVPQIGREVNGSRRWLPIFGDTAIQASDFAKIALVLMVSTYLHDNQRKIRSFKTGILAPLCLIGVFCLPILAEPDYGTTALCGAVGLALMFLAGCNWKILASIMGALAMAGSVLVYLNPNRLERVLAFMDLENTKLEGSYQLYQAILGFGSGGVFGKGIGQGRQQLSFLPEAHTDFVFAIVGEELGLLATAGMVALFAAIFFAGVYSMRRAKNKFELYMMAGSLFMIAFQAIFNLCVVTGLMPTKGISLPFISYGGSNLVVMFIFVGIIFNCMRSWSKPTKIEAVEYE